jgi:hypothetical protein
MTSESAALLRLFNAARIYPDMVSARLKQLIVLLLHKGCEVLGFSPTFRVEVARLVDVLEENLIVFPSMRQDRV